MINEQLLTFIKQQLSKGLNKEIIINELLSGGWSTEDINEGFNVINAQTVNLSINPVVTHPVVDKEAIQANIVVNQVIPSDIVNPNLNQTSKTSIKKVFLIVGGFLVLACIVAGYLFRNNIPFVKDLIKNNSVPVIEIKQEDNTQSQIKEEETIIPITTPTEQVGNLITTDSKQVSEPIVKKETVVVAPAKTTTTIGVIDCGTDSSCFINSANTCQKAKMVLNQKNAPFLEIGFVDYSENIEVTGKEGNNCIFRTKIIDYKFKYSDYGISGMLEQGSTQDDIKNSEASMDEAVVGVGQICKIDSSKKVGDAISNFMIKSTSGDMDVSCENSICFYNDGITCESFAKLNDNPNCTLDASFIGFAMSKGESMPVSVSAFKGKESQVSWSVKDNNIASISSTTGASITVKSVNVGSTELIATDNAVGKSCFVTISVETTQ